MLKRAVLNIFGVCATFMSSAYAAAAIEASPEPLTALFLRGFFLVAISSMAWAAASLPDLAGWEGGTKRDRLEIGKIFLKAQLFGFIGFYTPQGVGLNIMACYVAAAMGAYGAVADTNKRERDKQQREADPGEGAK